jgi:hypothetical protein
LVKKLGILFLLLLFWGAVFYYFFEYFYQSKAQNGNTITNQATLTYQDQYGYDNTVTSNQVTTEIIELGIPQITIKANLENRSWTNYSTNAFELSVYSALSNFEGNPIQAINSISLDVNGQSDPMALDSTTLPKTYDFLLKHPGFLGSKKTSVTWSLAQNQTIDFGTLMLGDFTDDNSIDISDFAVWVARFGQTPTGGNDFMDANQDGLIDISDFAIIFKNFGK